MQEYNNMDLETRKAIATDFNSPPEILEKLSEDSDRDIRLSVASNPNTPIESTVICLLNDCLTNFLKHLDSAGGARTTKLPFINC